MTGTKSTVGVLLAVALVGLFLLWSAGAPGAIATLTAPRSYQSSGGAVERPAERPAPPPPPPPGEGEQSEDADYPEIITAGDQVIRVSPEAWQHILAKHGEWALHILRAINSGACLPELYMTCGFNSGSTGVKGYFVCPGMYDLYGRERNGIVAVLWDAATGRWETMTSFYGQNSYLRSALSKDGCLPLALVQSIFLGEGVHDDRY